MSKTQFDEETRDQTLRDMMRLAHNTLNRIKNISKEKGGGLDNPLGFLALVLLFSSIFQSLAIERGADITQAFLKRTMEKMRKREFTYVG